jgi:membrane protein YqaA with SNARE-associated domain
MGRGAHEAVARGRHTRHLRWFARLGPPALLLSWLPGVGDPLCAVAGWLRLPFWQSVAWMAIGKLFRYTAMTWLLMSVPNGWWKAAVRIFAG